jgi:hypothetical protein
MLSTSAGSNGRVIEAVWHSPATVTICDTHGDSIPPPPLVFVCCAQIRVRVEIMASQNCRTVGESQSGLILIDPMICTRTRRAGGGGARRAEDAADAAAGAADARGRGEILMRVGAAVTAIYLPFLVWTVGF